MDATILPAKKVVLRLVCIMLPALAMLTLTYVVPPLNPFKLPHFDLTGPVPVAAYWIAESGGVHGIPLLGLVMTACVVSRSGIHWRQRAIEAFVIAFVIAVLQGGTAYLNEHVIKPVFAVPRPNILELSSTPPESPTLAMSAEAFYALPDTSTKSEHLERVLTPDVKLDKRIRGHWISESGYSFPSGHSFSSMMFATVFLGLGMSCFSGRSLWSFYWLVPWAMMVCVSRPILRVHSPTDICVGGIEGLVVGTLALLLMRGFFEVLRVRRVGRREPGIVSGARA